MHILDASSTCWMLDDERCCCCMLILELLVLAALGDSWLLLLLLPLLLAALAAPGCYWLIKADRYCCCFKQEWHESMTATTASLMFIDFHWLSLHVHGNDELRAWISFVFIANMNWEQVSASWEHDFHLFLLVFVNIDVFEEDRCPRAIRERNVTKNDPKMAPKTTPRRLQNDTFSKTNLKTNFDVK